MKADGKIKISKTIYCDMDGVLADFNAEPDGIARFAVEKGFFTRLKPIYENVKAIRKLIADGNDVYILSASPNERADGEKTRWLHRYIKKLADGKIILMRNGQVKREFMKTPDGILFDDYGRNIREWCEADGNIGWKITADGNILKGIETLFSK